MGKKRPAYTNRPSAVAAAKRASKKARGPLHKPKENEDFTIVTEADLFQSTTYGFVLKRPGASA